MEKSLLKQVISLTPLFLFCFAILFVILTVFNKGTLVIETSPSSSVYINDNLVKERKVSLRSGTYQIKTIDKKNKDIITSIKVTPFSNQTFAPKLEKISEKEIVEKALGENLVVGNLELDNVRYFDNGNWFVASFSAGSFIPIVMHFDKTWIVEYYPEDSYLFSLPALPNEIQTYVKTLYEQNRDG